MNSTRSLLRIKMMVLALFTLPVAAGVVGAQQVPSLYRGKFTLPIEARWGEISLPPGDYTFTLNSNTPPAFVTVRGTREGMPARMILAQSVSERRSSEPSTLVLVRAPGVGVVRALHLAELGLDLEYPLPKGKAPKGGALVAEEPQLIQRVRVSAAGR